MTSPPQTFLHIHLGALSATFGALCATLPVDERHQHADQVAVQAGHERLERLATPQVLRRLGRARRRAVRRARQSGRAARLGGENGARQLLQPHAEQGGRAPRRSRVGELVLVRRSW